MENWFKLISIKVFVVRCVGHHGPLYSSECYKSYRRFVSNYKCDKLFISHMSTTKTTKHAFMYRASKALVRPLRYMAFFLKIDWLDFYLSLKTVHFCVPCTLVLRIVHLMISIVMPCFMSFDWVLKADIKKWVWEERPLEKTILMQVRFILATMGCRRLGLNK